MNTPLFRLSLLSLTLAAGFAHAENEAKDNVVLDTVTVKGQATSATHRVTTKRMEETTSTDLKDVLSTNLLSVSAVATVSRSG